jgi:hypothetical protein
MLKLRVAAVGTDVRFNTEAWGVEAELDICKGDVVWRSASDTGAGGGGVDSMGRGLAENCEEDISVSASAAGCSF